MYLVRSTLDFHNLPFRPGSKERSFPCLMTMSISPQDGAEDLITKFKVEIADINDSIAEQTKKTKVIAKAKAQAGNKIQALHRHKSASASDEPETLVKRLCRPTKAFAAKISSPVLRRSTTNTRNPRLEGYVTPESLISSITQKQMQALKAYRSESTSPPKSYSSPEANNPFQSVSSSDANTAASGQTGEVTHIPKLNISALRHTGATTHSLTTEMYRSILCIDLPSLTGSEVSFCSSRKIQPTDENECLSERDSPTSSDASFGTAWSWNSAHKTARMEFRDTQSLSDTTSSATNSDSDSEDAKPSSGTPNQLSSPQAVGAQVDVEDVRGASSSKSSRRKSAGAHDDYAQLLSHGSPVKILAEQTVPKIFDDAKIQDTTLSTKISRS